MNEPEYEPVTVYYSLRGEKFHPSKLQLDGGVEIVKANDPGHIGSTGRYRGKPLLS